MALLKKWTFENKFYFILIHVVLIIALFKVSQYHTEKKAAFNLFCNQVWSGFSSIEWEVDYLLKYEENEEDYDPKLALDRLKYQMPALDRLFQAGNQYIDYDIKYYIMGRHSYFYIYEQLEKLYGDEPVYIDEDNNTVDRRQLLTVLLAEIQAFIDYVELDDGIGYTSRKDLTPRILNNLTQDFFAELYPYFIF